MKIVEEYLGQQEQKVCNNQRAPFTAPYNEGHVRGSVTGRQGAQGQKLVHADPHARDPLADKLQSDGT